MSQFLPFKKNHMNTNDPMIMDGTGRLYLTAAMVILLLSGLFTSAIAQKKWGDGDRNGGGREGGNRQSSMR
jgi:hypothetical protein